MSSHNYDTTLTHNFVRPGGQQEPIKTGGILIRPEDALPQYQDQIHTNPRNNVSYATLKPWVQIQDEQGGIVHSTGSSNSVDMMSMSAPPARFDERPITNAPPSRVYSRQFTYEFMKEKPDSDVIKTGGIVVNPYDVHTSQRHSVQKDPKSGVSYAMLKPWTQIQDNQGGIVHSRHQEVGPRKVDEIDKSRHRRTYTSVHDFVQPDVMGIQNQMAQSEILHRSKTEIDHIQQREPHLTPSQPADILHVPGAHTTRVIKPEDMLSWMRDYSKQGNVPYPLNRILVDRQMTRGEELDKIHEVGIEKENSQIPELERKAGNDQVQGNVISTLRQRNSGSSYCELKRPDEEREPIKTGGIIVNPRDVYTNHRSALQPLPNSNLSFAQLKPWKQIEGEQSGIIHNSVVKQKPPHMSLSKKLRKSRNPPSMTESVGTREFQGEFSRSGDVERVKGGKGTMLVNPEDMRAPSQIRDNDIENFDRLNPETRELLTSHARSKSMYYSTHDMVKPNEYILQPMTESVMLPTQTTLNELDARLDRVLNRSRNVLFEASSGSVPSLTGLDDNIGMGPGNYQSEIGYKGTSLGF